VTPRERRGHKHLCLHPIYTHTKVAPRVKSGVKRGLYDYSNRKPLLLRSITLNPHFCGYNLLTYSQTQGRTLEMIAHVHVILEGQVQGVGFRWFIQRTAEQLGVFGWVRNLPNGFLEFEAEAETNVLETFLASARNGPKGALVKKVTLNRSGFTVDKNPQYHSFEIIS
jgi:acylphosphatase